VNPGLEAALRCVERLLGDGIPPGFTVYDLGLHPVFATFPICRLCPVLRNRGSSPAFPSKDPGGASGQRGGL